MGDRRVMLTHWIGQAWREFHQNSSHIIRQTFRKLGLSLAVDGSEDAELSIKDLPNIEVGDWRLTGTEAEPEDPVEIDEATGWGEEDNIDDENEAVDGGEVEYDLIGEGDQIGGDDSGEENDQNDDHLGTLD